MISKKQDYDYNYKVILVGDRNVGKTSFVVRYTKGIQKPTMPTIGVEYATKSILLQKGEGIAKVQLWDTSGHEKQKAITTAHQRNSSGALLFYDLTDENTFKNVKDWLEKIKDHTEEGIVIMLIGNKLDIIEEDNSKRKVNNEEVLEFCKANNLLYQETSARTGFNVKESFENLVENIFSENSKKEKVREAYEEDAPIKLRSTNNQETLTNQQCCTSNN